MFKKLFLQCASLFKGLFTKKPNKRIAELIDRTKTELANLSDEKLESSILRYEIWYFKCIGEHHPEVIEFRTAIEQKNIQLITEKWSDFFGKFIGYERAAGITGRPYIIDCYSSYHFSLEEFEKRQKHK